MNQRLRSCLDMIKPSLHQQMSQNNDEGLKQTVRKFHIGDTVYVQNYALEPKWLDGIVTGVTGPLSYIVKTEAKDFRCHIDQIHARLTKSIIADDNLPPSNIDTSDKNVTPTIDISEKDLPREMPVLSPKGGVKILCRIALNFFTTC